MGYFDIEVGHFEMEVGHFVIKLRYFEIGRENLRWEDNITLRQDILTLSWDFFMSYRLTNKTNN